MSKVEVKKGRAKELIINRNKKLCARFYFYSNLVGLRFERCLSKLKEEFDISESRIDDILSECNEQVAQLENDKMNEKDLKKVYPFFNWSLSV
ncbi:hypothetical protein [Empedobacter falsenii]